jgi:hypothetical protein
MRIRIKRFFSPFRSKKLPIKRNQSNDSLTPKGKKRSSKLKLRRRYAKKKLEREATVTIDPKIKLF